MKALFGEKGGRAMESVAGIFKSRRAAEEAVQKLRSVGIADNRVVLLAPGTTVEEIEAAVPSTDTEQEGMGKAMGGTVGAAMGVAGGATLGAAAASLVVPGVGPIIAAGVLAAAVLGTGGAIAGAAAGDALEEGLAPGLAHDELFIYEDALRKGRSVVIAFADDDNTERIREIFAAARAEGIDSAREDWWLGLRDAENEHYRTQGKDFNSDEVSYRRGFEAALNRKCRGKEYEELAPDLKQFYEESGADEAFQRGYQRGLQYQKRLESRAAKTGS
jgi:hypothetical protein